jgi:hypothetical protein
MSQRSRTTVLAVTSDQHAGSTVALCPHRIALDDGGHYEASKAQRWLWNHWGNFWDRVEHRVKEHRGSRLVQVFNGDMTDGDHHGTTQILSGNPTAQAAVVNEIMTVPLALKPDALAFVRGTEAHVGKSAAFEERIALGLKKDRRPVVMDTETGTASHWHLKMDIDGVRLDFAHHGRMGTRPWTKPNPVAMMAVEILYEHAAAGLPFPHIAFRSHQHRFVDTGNLQPVRAIQTPAWQLATAFIHRINPGAIADVGGIIVIIKDGQFEVEPVIYHPEAPKAWRPAA